MARSRSSRRVSSARQLAAFAHLESLEPRLLLNSAPTDISLSTTSVAENQPTGTVVGTLSTTDPDADDTFVYSLITGDGSTGNWQFTIDGNLLKTARSIDYEVYPVLSIRIQSTDSVGQSVEKVFQITVENVAEAPAAVRLSDTWLTEGPAGTTVCTLSSFDSDTGDTHSYSLVPGDGDDDNDLFCIEGTALKSAIEFSYEGYNAYHVRIRSTDSTGLWVERSFKITVIPSDLTPPMAVLDPMLPVASTMKLVVSGPQDSLSSPAVARAADGRMIVVWTSTDAGGTSLIGCLYNADGRQQRAPFTLVEGIATGSHPAVAMAADGRFVLAWKNAAGAICVQAFDRDAMPVGQATAVATPSGTLPCDWPAVAVDTNGNGVVVWRIFGPSSYQARGAAIGVDGHVGASTWLLLPCTIDDRVSVCMMDGGQFFVTWKSSGTLYIGRYSANGQQLTSWQRVPSTDSSDGLPFFIRRPDGIYTAVWRRRVTSESGVQDSIVYQAFGISTSISSIGSSMQWTPPSHLPLLAMVSTAILPGGFVLCWGETNDLAGMTQILMQDFTASGQTVEALTEEGGAEHTFTITYTDAGGVDPTSLDDLDLRVTNVPDQAGQWVLDGVLDLSSVTPGSSPNPYMVAVDGNVAVVGGRTSVAVFERSESGQWANSYLFSTEMSNPWGYPYAVAVDGTTVVVGSHWQDPRAYVIEKGEDAIWSCQPLLSSPEFPITGCFVVDVDGDTVAVGSATDWSPGRGPVIFVRNEDGTYSPTAVLERPYSSATPVLYGGGVAIAGDIALVPDWTSSSMHIFENTANGWEAAAEIALNPSVPLGWHYGYGLAAGGASVYATPSGPSVIEWRRNSDGVWYRAPNLSGGGDVSVDGNWLATKATSGLRLYERQPDGSWVGENLVGATGGQVAIGDGRVACIGGSQLYIYARPELISSGDSFDARAELVSVTAVEGGYRAEYRVAAPAGGWSSANNGTYAIWLEDGQVADLNGNLSYGGMMGTFKVAIAPAATVAGRHIFYNSSALDGNNAAANASDDAAIAAGKSALLPGGTTGLANFTSYSRGINGIMVDIANLGGAPTAADFVFTTGNNADPATWTTAASPASITVRYGAGVGGSDRVTIVWADGAIQDGWLRVEVLATANTGLAEADVFYWGNIRGDTTGDGRTNVFDLLNVRANYLKSADDPTRDSRADLNMDGNVNVFDLLTVRQNYLQELYLGASAFEGQTNIATASESPAALPDSARDGPNQAVWRRLIRPRWPRRRRS